MWEIPKLAQTYVKNKKKDYKYKRNIRNCSVYIDVNSHKKICNENIQNTHHF